MKLVCVLADRALARSRVTGKPIGGALARHVGACPRCQTAATSYAELAANVSASLCLPTPSEAFTQRVLGRIETCPPRAATLPRALWVAPVLAAAVAGLWVLGGPRREAAHSGGKQAHARIARSPDTGDPIGGAGRNARTAPDRQSPPTSARTGAVRQATRRAAEALRKRERDAVLRILLRSRRKVASTGGDGKPSGTGGRQVATAGATGTNVTWAQWGAYCEMNADYRQAAAAYARAHAQSGDLTVGFAAGRAAEAAGDVSAAVMQYSRILSGTAATAGGGDESGSVGAGSTSSYNEDAARQVST